ncbi:MAG: hypothetical protein HQ539_03730 [Parcubacteria group bacterium]|nr:hypothetical protein [Parcubacteria group bacterium]
MKKTYIMIAVIVLVVSATGVALAGMGHKFFSPEKQQAMLEKKAELLGMEVEELQSKLDEGQTLKEIFEEAGITKEGMWEKKQVGLQEWMDSLVEQGKLTQEEADLKLEKMQEMKEKMKDIPEECEEYIGHWGMGRRGKGMRKPFHEE